ncbi:MAG TPA: transcriptional regulator [Clostridiales bacterium]|nr:transcriptional regulator [Clostridiales bacterium]
MENSLSPERHHPDRFSHAERRPTGAPLPEQTRGVRPPSRAADILGRKWTIPIILELASGPKRFCKLQATLKGISPRTLSARLRWLQREGVVGKTALSEPGLHEAYHLTEKGLAFRPVLRALRAVDSAWARRERRPV